jgi:Icc-related predicted phosphoesterase
MSETAKFEELFVAQDKHSLQNVNELNFLVVTDIHKSLPYIEKLKEWQMETKHMFDYVFCLGDILNLKEEDQKNDEIVFKSEGELSSIINYLENICLNVLYIPGNHEPHTLFRKCPPKLTVKSQNIHKCFYQITKDLYVFGFGGSVPTILSKFNVDQTCLFTDITNDILWEGYPFIGDYDSADNAFKTEFMEAWSSGLEEIKNERGTLEGIKFILLTHNGPFYSNTSVLNYKNRFSYMGSKFLNNFINNSTDILADLHGHTHDGKGLCKVNNVEVINAGPLLFGNFLRMKLKRDTMLEWCVAGLEFNNLNFV